MPRERNSYINPNNPSQASTNRAEMEAQKTLQQIREEGENIKQNIKLNHLNQYFRKAKKLAKEFHDLNIRDAKYLNWEREKLEEKYASLLKKNRLSAREAQKKIAKELYLITREYNLKAAKEAVEDRLKFNKLEYEQQEKERIKNYKKQQKDEKKNLQARLKDWKSNLDEYTKTTKNYLEDALGFSDEAKKQQAAIMEKASTKQEGYKARLEANNYDIEAQIMTKLNDNLNKFVDNIENQFQGIIEDYSSYQSKVNARLQGSGQSWNGFLGIGVGISETLMAAVGNNPYVKLADLLENASKAVESGIAYNIEQRAFLETVKEDIATTFDAFDSNLLRIVRLQQSDSTAARLGLEANLTKLFNSYFSDSSYLSDAFDSVSSNLSEAIAQMGSKEGVAFEYQVQKWLGSLYSVGFSSQAIGNIASALGQLGSGDVSGLASNSQMQNLIVLAASRAGLSYADLLTNGLNANTTNTLLESMVEYLQEIANSDNKVIKSQYSQIFGLTASDLVAAKNLGKTALNIANTSLGYGGAILELYNQVAQLPLRLSIGEMTGNMIDNVKYTIGSGIAKNPVTYALWELTDMVEQLSGGIQIPTISVMGNSFDLNTSLTNLARLGIVGAGALGNVGNILSGISSTKLPATMLMKLGIFGQSNTITRGKGLGRSKRLTGQLSSSNIVGNSAGEDYEASLTAQANAKGNAAVEAKKEEEKTKSINDIHEYLLQVFDPKVTAITQMLARVSGTELSNVSSWNTFEDSNLKKYTATTVSIVSLGEANNNSQLISNIEKNILGILQILQKPLDVKVLSYPVLNNLNVQTGQDTNGTGM